MNAKPFFVKLGGLAMTLLILAACQSSPRPAEVVRNAVVGWDQGDIDAAMMDASLAYYAEDAVVKLIGLPPGQPDRFSGKTEIRAWWEGLAQQHFNFSVEVLKEEGDTVTTRTLTWMDWSRQAGIAPIVGTEIYVVRDGKIVSETWTISEESLAQLTALMQPAPTPTTAGGVEPTGTAAPRPEPPTTPIAGIDDIVGAWRVWVRGDPYRIEFQADGVFVVGDEDVNDWVERGTFAIEGNQLVFLTSPRDCSGAEQARYEVYVAVAEGKPVLLRFVLVGSDECANRREALAGKTVSRLD